MNAIDTKQPFTLAHDPVFTQIDDEVVLISPRDDQNYALNPVGTALWNMLKSQPMSMEDMVHDLQQIYDVEDTRALTDIAAFLQTMLDHQLVVPA
jgi:hypothetical protein